jgi:hypothetical protein
MTKLVQAFLSGVFFTFILDFFIFLGVKENYIDTHNIQVYYNILFADHQNIFIFFLFTVIIGYLVIYAKNKIAIPIIGVLFILCASTLIPPIGKMAGTFILMKKNATIKTNRFSYHGNIYYDGRKDVTLYDDELKKVIILDKNKIIGEY